jgi:hypothetical protein
MDLLHFGRVTLLCFLIFLVFISALRLMRLRPSYWLEFLNTCSLSIELSSMFRHESEVAGLRCYFLPLYWGFGSVAKYSPTCWGHQASSPALLRLGKTSWSLL